MMISLFEREPEGRVVVPLEFHVLAELSEGRQGEMEVEASRIDHEPAKKTEQEMNHAAVEAHAAELEKHVEAARTAAWAEARQVLGCEYEERVAREHASIITACEQFDKERKRYFADVEAEVVRLALSIAARVLHREAEIDPLLLQGAVRVALEKVQDESSVVLRVAEDRVENWKKILAAGRGDVAVVKDTQLVGPECVLETNVGKVELGIKAQLEEIERGFFDLLERRPA
jgi:flagellar assembly protein FliH